MLNGITMYDQCMFDPGLDFVKEYLESMGFIFQDCSVGKWDYV